VGFNKVNAIINDSQVKMVSHFCDWLKTIWTIYK
jgi:hypothetical protein